jgi:uncharacterized membrane protein
LSQLQPEASGDADRTPRIDPAAARSRGLHSPAVQVVVWTALGLAYGGWALRSALQAEPGNAKVFYLPLAGGLMTALSAITVTIVRRRQSRDEEQHDVPKVQSTFKDVCLLTAVFLAAWAVMPYLGLVLASVVLFIVLALVYRDQRVRGVALGVVILLVLLVLGAERLLEMPLLRSPYLNLPF